MRTKLNTTSENVRRDAMLAEVRSVDRALRDLAESLSNVHHNLDTSFATNAARLSVRHTRLKAQLARFPQVEPN